MPASLNLSRYNSTSGQVIDQKARQTLGFIGFFVPPRRRSFWAIALCVMHWHLFFYFYKIPKIISVNYKSICVIGI